jgi:hypothetical protein
MLQSSEGRRRKEQNKQKDTEAEDYWISSNPKSSPCVTVL